MQFTTLKIDISLKNNLYIFKMREKKTWEKRMGTKEVKFKKFKK